MGVINTVEYVKSDAFRKEFEAEVNKTTWDVGLPKFYMLNGWLVEHHKNGQIKKIKQIL